MGSEKQNDGPKADKNRSENNRPKNNRAGKSKRRSRKIPDNTECQNCGALLQGDYCHQCGQAAREPRRLVIGLVQDVFVDTLAIDGKLARSIMLLLWRPGVLARRYLDGKRVHYSPPFRLYLFASVFFFFAASLMINVPEGLSIEDGATVDPAEIEAAKEDLEEARQEFEQTFGDAAPDGVFDVVEGTLEASAAAAQDPNNEDAEDDPDEKAPSFKDSTWEDANYEGPAWLEPHVKRLYEAGQRVTDDPRLFASEARQNVPRFLLLAPVLYGLTLALLYFYRRKFVIFDHFIVSLYMHAALYSYLLLALLISRIPIVGDWLWIVPVGWGLAQPLVVLRQAYNSNWVSVWIKWLISALIYLIAFVLIITLGLSYSLYQS